jgi:hypothetical protein
MEDFDGDREAARDLNFFALRILFQMDSKDVTGLQAKLKASFEAEQERKRRKQALKVVRRRR